VAENRDRGLDPNSTEAIGELLKDLVWKIDRVKTLYEQYFMGIEKIEPMVPRKDIQRAMLQLQQIYIRNTGLRFKFNTMLQKWSIYTTYWNRTLREIENGTYIKHIQKAKRAAEREGKALPDEIMKGTKQQMALARAGGSEVPTPRTLDVDTMTGIKVNDDDMDLDIEKALAGLEWVTPAEKAPEEPAAKPAAPPPAARPATPPPASRPAPPPAAKPAAPPPPKAPPPPQPAAARPPTPPPAAASRVAGMDEGELRALHAKYLEARRATGESEVRYETLVNSLAKSGKEGMRFDVQVHNGKAVVKAIKRK
jgi:hypothetical protein